MGRSKGLEGKDFENIGRVGEWNFSFLSCAVVLNGKKTREKRNFVEDNDLPNNIGEFEKFNSAFEIKILRFFI